MGPGAVAEREAGRLVEVAVDAAGAGGARPYTYRAPEALADLEPGEAVLVEFGRRQALGVVLGAAEAAPGATVKPIVDRVRADGPLLPPLTLELARWIAARYLAPPARLAEFFGLWGLAVKAASIFGPLTYGVVTWMFEGNHRLGILAVGAYFVIGLALLAGIDVERGRRTALQSA